MASPRSSATTQPSKGDMYDRKYLKGKFERKFQIELTRIDNVMRNARNVSASRRTAPHVYSSINNHASLPPLLILNAADPAFIK